MSKSTPPGSSRLQKPSNCRALSKAWFRLSICCYLVQQQPCWNRVFELLLQGHPLQSGSAASSSAVNRLPPNVPLMMLAWGKLEAYAVDRRLMGLQT